MDRRDGESTLAGTRVLLETKDRGWLLSTDGGRHVHALHQAYAALDPSGARGLFALRDGTILHSSDNGRHWLRRARLAGASGIAVDRGGRLIYVVRGTSLSVSRDAGATLRQVGPFVGSVRVGEAPALAAAGDVVTGSLPGAGLPEVVDQAPRDGYLVAAPTGDALTLTRQTTLAVRTASGGWHDEPFAGAQDSLPTMDSHGVAYLASAIDDTAPGMGIAFRIVISSHSPGGTWTAGTTVATTTSLVQGRQWVVTDTAGDLLVVWNADGVWGSVLRAGATSWGAPVKISGDDVVAPLGELALAGGGNGTFVVAWDAISPLAAIPSVPRSTRIQAAGTWSPPADVYPLPVSPIATPAGSSLVVDSAGTALLLAPTVTGPESFTWAPDAGGWTAGVPLAPAAGAGEAYGQPAFALGPDGTATAVYTHADAHELELRASTSHAPYTAWTPDTTALARAEACPAADCLVLVPPALTYAPCAVVCAADGAPPTVASVASRTVASLETSRGLLVVTRDAGSDSWRSARARTAVAGTIGVTGATRKGLVAVRLSCAIAPCTARVVLETAPGSPLGDRLPIASVSGRVRDTDPATWTVTLPPWVRQALAGTGSLPVRLVLETSGGGYADPVVERDDLLRASS